MCAWSIEAIKEGIAIAAIVAMIAQTISNSIRLKPFRLFFFRLFPRLFLEICGKHERKCVENKFEMRGKELLLPNELSLTQAQRGLGASSNFKLILAFVGKT